jgi:hypothetical protein
MDTEKIAEVGLGAGVTALVGGAFGLLTRIRKIEARVGVVESILQLAVQNDKVHMEKLEKLGDKMTELSNALSALAATMRMVADLQAEGRQHAHRRHTDEE